MDGIAPGWGPIGVGCVKSWPRLKVRRGPRLNVVAVMLVITRRRFASDGVACKADRESDRNGKAFDHGSSSEKKRRRVRFVPPPASGRFAWLHAHNQRAARNQSVAKLLRLGRADRGSDLAVEMTLSTRA
jgi:hypothetical protein